MATNQYYNAGFNPLAAEDMESLSIQTENAGFHEIKIYNNTKDKLWELSDMLNIAASLPDVVLIGKNLQNLLVRADTVWEGIKEGANKKRVNICFNKTLISLYHVISSSVKPFSRSLSFSDFSS